MPKQNRVTPSGEIIATSARGTFMGNRGLLHNEKGQIIRPYQVRRWIICRLAFKGRQRQVMKPGRYTELFFLDEATALAAGHRPCYECRRQAFVAFREAWAAANPRLPETVPVKADDIDRVLHDERMGRQRQKLTYEAVLAELPSGVFVAIEKRPWLLWHDALLPWSPAGYGRAIKIPSLQTVRVLTPRSTVRALAQGYLPEVHETAAIP